MRRLINPANLISLAIVAVVIAIVARANWKDGQQSRGRDSAALPLAGPLAGTGAGTGAGFTTSRADLEARVKAMDARVASHPDDVRAALQLADGLLRLTRVTGNTGLAVRAEDILKKALAEDPGNYDVNRMLGALYLSRHRFRDAIAAGEKARDLRPDDPLNYGVIGDGHLELGDYPQAFAAFDRMMQLRPSAAAYARVAYARELQGDLRGAVVSMKLAADATAADDPEALAWTRAQLGELYLQLGRLHDAKVEFSSASQAFPGHPFAVAGYAKVIAAEGDAAGALTLLEGLARTSPTPDLAARIGDLLDRLGRREEALKQYALAEAGWRGDVPEPKALARFLADHGKPDDALTVALAAAADRHDVFTEDALAWAYFKTGRLAEARKTMALALRTGTQDKDIRSHAVSIAGASSLVAAQ